jgi:beta-glucanase (GH16 family)
MRDLICLLRRFVILIAALAVTGLVGAPPATDPAGAHAGNLAAPNCAGEVPLPKPDGSSWTCTFDDEFDSTTGDASALNTSWWAPQLTATSGFYTGRPPNYACYVDSPENISISGGALHLTVRRRSAPVRCGASRTRYTAGMVSSDRRFSQTYGRFEVRARLPQTTAAGLQETLWLWPVDATKYGPWPASGEVDFAEFYSQYSALDVPYVHYDYDSASANPLTNTNVVTNYCPIALRSYNDYAVVWQPGHLQITVNGIPCLTDGYRPSNVSSAAPFDQPFFVALTQALGIGSNAFKPSSTPLPATTSIDYVRVWR